MKFINTIVNLCEKRKNRCAEDMILCVAITLACGFYYFEGKQPFMEYIRPTLEFLMLCCWVGLAFKNGIKERVSFLMFSTLYWMIPQIFIYLYNINDNVKNYSSLLKTSQRYSELLVKNPLDELSQWLNISHAIVAIAFTVFCGLVFIGGFMIKRVSAHDEIPAYDSDDR